MDILGVYYFCMIENGNVKILKIFIMTWIFIHEDNNR